MDLATTTWVKDFSKLSRDLAKISPELRGEFRDELRPVAGQVASGVKTVMPVRTGAARGTVRPGVTNKGAYVKVGSKAVPYVGWLEFGGVLKPTGRRFNTQRRPVVKRGRYLRPTIDRYRDEINRAAIAAVDGAARIAGWNR